MSSLSHERLVPFLTFPSSQCQVSARPLGLRLNLADDVTLAGPGFHTSAENSSGIGKGLDAKHITPANHGGEKASLPNEVEDCIADNMASYEYLRRFV